MKKALFKILQNLITKHYWQVLIGSIIITIIMLIISTHLDIKAYWLAMVPQNDPTVTEFKTILKEFGNAEGIIVVIESKNKTELTTAVDEIVLELKKEEYIKNLYYQPPRDFIKQHGLMIQKEKDLKMMRDLLTDPNLVPFITSINDNLEKEYIEESGDGLVKKEREAVYSVSSIKTFIENLENYINTGDSTLPIHSADEFLLGPEYFYSRNRDKAIIIIIPTISSIDYNKAVVIVNQIDNKLAEIIKKYSDTTAGITGMHVIARDEMEVGKEDTMTNLVIALVFVSLLFIFSFRMLSAPLLAMFNLLIGIIWTVGLTTIIIGEMDIMTLMIAVILIGLGVDYSIHILATYSEAQLMRKSPEDSIIWSIDKSGSGIITGALTTAMAFFALIFTDFKGFREFGIVMGMGIISVLISSLTLLPALLIIKDKHLRKKQAKEKVRKQPGIDALSNLGEKLSQGAKPIIIVIAILFFTVFLFFKSFDLSFDGNLMNLEPVGLKSVELQDVLEDDFDISADPIFVTASSLEENFELTKKIEKIQSVSIIDSISYYLPTDEQFLKRKKYVNDIRSNAEKYLINETVDMPKLQEELERLEDNLFEMADMSYLSGLDRLTKYLDDFLNLDQDGKKRGENIFGRLLKSLDEEKMIGFQKEFAPRFKELVLSISNDSKIGESDLPDFLKSLYISNSGDKYLISFYSSNNLWKEMRSNELNIYRDKVSESVTGTPMFVKTLIETGQQEGKKATIIAFIAIFILAFIDLRDLRLTILAMLPLIAGAIWMIGIMALTNHKFNMVNILAIPLIIGIGIDDGIHIIHRYLIEGKGGLKRVIRSTGRAVILTSFTTVIAFGSLITARYRGYASFGLVITYGVLACMILSVIFMPALLKLFYEKLNWRIRGVKRNEEAN